ncbi:MAG: HlyD family secretion protein [Bacteroidota bacterium]
MSIKENVERLKSKIEIWKKTYLIIAPVAGKVSFSKIWSEQQFVNTGEEVLTVVPMDGVGKIVGKALLPIANLGKVKPEQTVNIQLDGFPFQEYGVIKIYSKKYLTSTQRG